MSHRSIINFILKTQFSLKFRDFTPSKCVRGSEVGIILDPRISPPETKPCKIKYLALGISIVIPGHNLVKKIVSLTGSEIFEVSVFKIRRRRE